MAKGLEKNARGSLSREVIVDAAYCMIDEDGLDSFTMRALGARLGVSAMACYAHFSSREEILAAVMTRFMATMDTDAVPGERWDATLRRTMTSIHRSFSAHPNMFDIDLDLSVAYGGLAAHTEKIVKLHLEQGIPEDLLGRMWAMVDAFLCGFDAGSIAAAKRDRAGAAAGGAPEALPTWERIVREAYSEESFQSGIDIIIGGIRALVAPDPCEWRTPEA